MKHREFWVVEDPYDVTTKQVIIAGILVSLAWVSLGVAIGRWIYG